MARKNQTTAAERSRPSAIETPRARKRDRFRDALYQRIGRVGLDALQLLIVSVQRLVVVVVVYVAATALVFSGIGQMAGAVAGGVGINDQMAMVDLFAYWMLPALAATLIITAVFLWAARAYWKWNERQITRVRTWLGAAGASQAK